LAHEAELLRSRFLGSLLGTGIGDSLGAGLAWRLARLGRELAPRYTDDTHMMIGVAESLIAKRGFDGEHMFLTFVKNWEAEPWRGYGPGPPAIFRAYRRGLNPADVARVLYPGGGSFGNGAAMRIAPIACFYHDDLDELRRVAIESAKLTHTHPLGVEGAVIQALAIAYAIRTRPGELEPTDFAEALYDEAKSRVFKHKLKALKALLAGRPDRRLVVRQLGNGVEAFNSVPTAIYAFLATQSFEQALRLAVGLGGDADTIGAMTGALAGAYHGVEAIPARWLDELEDRAYIEQLATRLWELKVLRPGLPRPR